MSDTYRSTTLHGHSDFGYHAGDFDYTRLDQWWWTGPDPREHFFLGFLLHFRDLEDVEIALYGAVIAGNAEGFELLMHMGQDWFSHIGRGYNEGTHLLAHAKRRAMKGKNYPEFPDYPYRDLDNRYLNAYYEAANEWTKQYEDLWYLFWDMDRWIDINRTEY